MKEGNEPFNDKIDHFNKIEESVGSPSNIDLTQLPKPLKYFGYLIIVFFCISTLLLIIFSFLD